MLAPFQAAALKIYTNEPLDQRLDLLASEIGDVSKQAKVELWINDRTNLMTTEGEFRSAVTVSNFITLKDRRIQINVFNQSKYPAINAFVIFAAPLDLTNLTMDGWHSQPQDPVSGDNNWRYDADKSVPKFGDWHISTIEVSTNFTGSFFICRLGIAADNSETKDYFVGFMIQK